MNVSLFSLISILLYANAFLNIRYIPQYNLFRDVCIVLIALYLIMNAKKVYKKCNKKILSVLLVFVTLLIVSFFINIDIAFDHRNDLIVFSISLLEFYLCLSFISFKSQYLIDMFSKLQGLFVIINDLLIIFLPGLSRTYGEVYLLGDKFTVGYQHLILIGLILTRESIRKRKIQLSTKIKIFLLMILLSYISFLTNSITSLLLIPLFMIFVILKSKGYSFAYSRNGYISVLALSTLFVFFYELILNISVVQTIITQVLGKTATLTARTRIYALIPTLLQGKWLWGYGYGTSYNMMSLAYQFPNTQNGIMEWVWQGGIFAAIALLICIWLLLKNVNSSNSRFDSYRFLYAVVCVFAVVASVEIVINLQYITLLFLIYYLSKNNVDGELNYRR